MEQYTDYKSILNEALDKYTLQDFELKENDDDYIVLYHQGEEILRINQTSLKATPAFLQCECESHLTMYHGVG
jgi:hypothetical protein